MENANYQTLLLNLVDRPVFCVKDRIITNLNTAAEQMQLSVGTDVCTLLSGDLEAYQNLKTGCLYLTMEIFGLPTSASVVRTDECDIFILESGMDNARLQAMALAAQQLRIPLSNVMTVSQQLQPDESEDIRKKIGQINRGLFQLLRIISNMADTQRYTAPDALRMESHEFNSMFYEVAEKAHTLLEGSGRRLKYSGLDHPVLGIGCGEALERAAFNLISNAVKFSSKGSTIHMRLSEEQSMLRLTVENRGDTISPQIMANLFNRYERQPGIEDGRRGIGLGLTLVRYAAAAHGGTVLVDQPPEGGTRITMTINIRTNSTDTLHSDVRNFCDYTGGWDMGLLELSESLNPDPYCPF